MHERADELVVDRVHRRELCGSERQEVGSASVRLGLRRVARAGDHDGHAGLVEHEAQPMIWIVATPGRAIAASACSQLSTLTP